MLVMLCLFSFISIAESQTVTVYNNFGPGNGGWDYVPNFGWSVAGPDVAPPQFGIEQAMQFKPTTTGVVTDLWVALFYMPNDPQYDEVTIKLARNPDGAPPEPGDVMEEWIITDFPECGTWKAPQHLMGKGTSYLEESETYWLWAVGGQTTWCGWSMNLKPNLTCPSTYRIDGQNWVPISNVTAPAFRIDVKFDYGLVMDTFTLSESMGGVVHYHLCAGRNNASRTYFLLGSMSGTTPGIPLPGGVAVLPLNWDVLSDQLLAIMNTPTCQNFTGQLSAQNGSAQATLDTSGPLPPGCAGVDLYFAYLLEGPWNYASNPVTLRIVP
jgi:hypothetical protein